MKTFVANRVQQIRENTNFERVLNALLNIKPNCYIITMWFITFSTKHLIGKTYLRFEQVFNKSKDKNIACPPWSILRPKSTLVHCIVFPRNED